MRLIDADALLKGKQDHSYISTHVIWNAPTIETQPIVIARWIEDPKTKGTGHYGRIKCTRCGEDFWEGAGSLGRRSFRYCPSCGAKMDASDTYTAGHNDATE